MFFGFFWRGSLVAAGFFCCGGRGDDRGRGLLEIWETFGTKPPNKQNLSDFMFCYKLGPERRFVKGLVSLMSLCTNIRPGFAWTWADSSWQWHRMKFANFDFFFALRSWAYWASTIKKKLGDCEPKWGCDYPRVDCSHDTVQGTVFSGSEMSAESVSEPVSHKEACIVDLPLTWWSLVKERANASRFLCLLQFSPLCMVISLSSSKRPLLAPI